MKKFLIAMISRPAVKLAMTQLAAMVVDAVAEVIANYIIYMKKQYNEKQINGEQNVQLHCSSETNTQSKEQDSGLRVIAG